MLLDDLMKKKVMVLQGLFLYLLMILLWLSSSGFAQEMLAPITTPVTRSAHSIDYIVAIVNEEVITRNELDEVIRTTVKQLQKQGVQLPPHDIIEKQLLERTIMNRAQLQRAKEVGITVSDTELDQTIRKIAKENNLSIEEFNYALQQDGMTLSEFREEIQNELLISRLKDREVSNRVNVTEGEIDNFLRTQETSAIGNDEYRVAHILVQTLEQMDSAQIEARRQRADSALKRLQEGADFAQVSAELSDAPNALQGGEIDWRPINQMGPTFAELLIKMQPGELTPVIRSPIGFHILKLIGRRPQETPIVMVNQTHARHILIKINELTSEDDAHRMVSQIRERTTKGADFAETAKGMSEDASANNGGDLGWLSPGDTVPEFERAMDALMPGQMSQPIQTQFGWHLIQVIERRTQDVSKDRHRNSARQAIRNRKADMVMQEWLQQLRDQTYVEYRTDDS